MNELVWLAGLVSLVILVIVLAPFFHGSGGELQDVSKQDSLDQLLSRQKVILERWLADEEAAAKGLLTRREWAMRQIYLTNRYVDVARRIDWISALQSQGGSL